MTTTTEALARADWLRPYKDHLLFPATSISIEVHGSDKPQCVGQSEAIDIMATLMLCMKEHGKDKAALKECARQLQGHTEDMNNRVFLADIRLAILPDAVIRIRLKELAQADNKARRQMIRDDVWPSWMMEDDNGN